MDSTPSSSVKLLEPIVPPWAAMVLLAYESLRSTKQPLLQHSYLETFWIQNAHAVPLELESVERKKTFLKLSMVSRFVRRIDTRNRILRTQTDQQSSKLCDSSQSQQPQLFSHKSQRYTTVGWLDNMVSFYLAIHLISSTCI